MSDTKILIVDDDEKHMRAVASVLGEGRLSNYCC